MKMPLIFDFCTPRISDDEKPIYRYDWDKNLNMVNWGGQNIPFIDCGSECLELITKTFAQREADDDNRVIYEMDTITKVDRESSDEDGQMMHKLVETETNTRVMREGNDIDLYGGLLELMTRTDVVRERDDE